MIHFRVVQAVKKMDRAWPACRQADANLPGELGVCACHERSQFLVARLDELRLVVRAIERAHNAVDAVTGIAVYARDSPFLKAPDEKIADCSGHVRSPWIKGLL